MIKNFKSLCYYKNYANFKFIVLNKMTKIVYKFIIYVKNYKSEKIYIICDEIN